jgi:undecaprenyl-diphosphatase
VPDRTRATHHDRRALADRTRLAELPLPGSWIPLALNGALLVLLLGGAVTLAPAVTALESSLTHGLDGVRTPALDAVALAIAFAFSPPAGTLLLLGVFAVQLFVRRAPVNAAAVTVVTGAGWLAVEPLTLLFSRPRPYAATMDEAIASHLRDDSFPSGHVAVATALAIGCALLARRRRAAVVGVGAVVMLVVAASRVYAGAHYPSDVLAGAVLAASTCLGAAGLWNAIGVPVLRRLRVLGAFGPIPSPQIGPRQHRSTFVSARPTS